jgi:DNA-binding response OmpR family regulator
MQIGPRILVIEDDPTVVTLLTEFLGEMEGYDVRLQKRGEDAHGAIKHGRPWLVILDLRLGGAESGWAVLDQLESDPETHGIPVLLCSAAVPSSLRALVTSQSGNVRVMGKPFDLDELLGTVQSMLASRTPLALQ